MFFFKSLALINIYLYYTVNNQVKYSNKPLRNRILSNNRLQIEQQSLSNKICRAL